MLGPEIERLIQLLARLPGLGPRSARRAALQLLKRKEALMQPLAEALSVAAERVVTCSVCGSFDTSDCFAMSHIMHIYGRTFDPVNTGIGMPQFIDRECNDIS